MRQCEEALQFLKRFRPVGKVWDGQPVLYKQVMREKILASSMDDLREACRLCNCNVVGLMEILGL